MRVSRLYVPVSLNVGKSLILDDDNAHYVKDVLRLKNAAPIVIFNGEGGEYLGTVLEISKKTVVCMIEQWIDRTVESPLKISLGLAISRGDRMDLSVQKAVELGVNEITPLITERCVVQLSAEKKSLRLNHWQKIAQHAVEQSGRTLLPEFFGINSLANWLTQQQGLKVFLDPHAQSSLLQCQPKPKHVAILTGPEGGFSGHERTLAKAGGFIPVRLGNRILRTETASIAALAAVQMLWGDFADPG